MLYGGPGVQHSDDRVRSDERNDMLRRLNVSTKVRAVLAVPMVVLLVAGVLVTWTAYQNLRYARTNSAVVTTLQAAEGLSPVLR
ncbi:MAG: hypothetical protein KJ548_10685, partial [Actinobacteria bacterium]|nr:hypothetical protein [Actinomycetota bacterium]